MTVQTAPGSADLWLQTFADAYRWPDDEDDAVDWMSIFCSSNYPVKPMTLPAAVASVEQRLADTAGADAPPASTRRAWRTPRSRPSSWRPPRRCRSLPGWRWRVLRAHELQPTDAGTLVNAAALATSIGMPNEAIAFLDGVPRCGCSPGRRWGSRSRPSRWSCAVRRCS